MRELCKTALLANIGVIKISTSSPMANKLRVLNFTGLDIEQNT